MGRWIADVDRHSVTSVPLLDFGEPRRALVDGFVPADLCPRVAGALERAADSVGVVVEVLEGDGLGADVAAAEGVIVVAADAEDLAVLVLDGDTAVGFTEAAGGERGGRHGARSNVHASGTRIQ